MTTDSPRSTLLRQSVMFTAGTFVGLLASVARAGVGARFLPTADMGIWLALQLFVGYLANLHCGVAFGMFRSVPLLLGRGDEAGAREELRTSWTFIVGMSVLVLIVGLVGGPFLFRGTPWTVIVLGDAIVFMTLLKTWYTSAFKAEKRFAELSVATSLSSIVSLVGVALIPRYGFGALLGGAAAQHAVETLVLVVRHELPKIGIVKPVLVAQLRVGIVTLCANIGLVAITTVDRTVMLKVLGTAAAGLFSIGAQISIMVPLIAAVPLAVLTPLYFERVGRGEDLLPLIDKASRLIAYAFPWVLGATGIALAPAITLFWPHLVGSIHACELSIVGTLPYVLVGPIANSFYAKDRQVPQVVIMFFCVSLMFGAAWLGVRLTGSIAGAAGGSALGMYAYYVVMTLAAFRLLERSSSDALRFLSATLAPSALALTVTLVLGVVLRPLGPSSSIPRALVAELVLTAAMMPFLLRARALVRGGIA